MVRPLIALVALAALWGCQGQHPDQFGVEGDPPSAAQAAADRGMTPEEAARFQPEER